MKSSTIRRSALSRETMNVIENLAGEEFVDYSQVEAEENNTPNEYLRPEEEKQEKPIARAKSQEIDLLWQTFKGAQFNTNSPWMQIVGGFLLGLFVSFLIVSTFLVYSANKTGNIVNSKQILINFGSSSKAVESVDVTSEVIPEEQTQQPEVVEETQDTQNGQVQESETAEVSSSYDYSQMKKYTIQDGDTVERIIKKYYGAYTPERAEAIMKANKLTNLDHISIGQVLLIPAEK